MGLLAAKFKSGNQLSPRSKLIWRTVQGLVWLTGAFIFFCLIFYPKLGIALFWNLLIPVAPALIAVAVGLWRNVCPLATTNLLPRKMGLSQRRIMTPL
ncbi:MAG: ferredoxin, partial [Bacteroidetes bacterium]|nr:ferredoxin [Bacteroidota bacterium]